MQWSLSIVEQLHFESWLWFLASLALMSFLIVLPNNQPRCAEHNQTVVSCFAQED
jgi:hypothetical protein